MLKTPELRILFPTNFSDACFRTSGAIAQLADSCRVSLTIAHVVKPGATTIQTRRELDSFLAEADHYDNSHRILLESDDPVAAIGDLCDQSHFDLVFAPASDRVGLHRFFNPSTRARLLKRCKAPLWTAGNCLDHALFKPALQTIACLLDFDHSSDKQIQLASALARRTGARMRIMAVIAPTSEGTLAQSIDSQAPLMPAVAVDMIRSAFVGQSYPEIDVAVGDLPTVLPRLLRRCDADLAFIGPGRALSGIWGTRLASCLDRLPCPAVCIDGASAGFDFWSFQAPSAAADTRELVHVRSRGAIAS